MDEITIKRAFSLAMMYAEKLHGRGFQAKICKLTGIDSSNLNSIIRKEKGTKESVRMAIFGAASSVVPEIKGMSYGDFLTLGEKLCNDGVAPDGAFTIDNSTSTNTATGSGNAQITASKCGSISINSQPSPGKEPNQDGTYTVNLSPELYEIYLLFTKIASPLMLELCKVRLLRKIEDECNSAAGIR